MLTTISTGQLSLPDDQTVPSFSPRYTCQDQLPCDQYEDNVKISLPLQETQTEGQTGGSVLVQKTYDDNFDIEILESAVLDRLVNIDMSELCNLLDGSLEAPREIGHQIAGGEIISPEFQNLEVVKMEVEVGNFEPTDFCSGIVLDDTSDESGQEETVDQIFNKIQGIGATSCADIFDPVNMSLSACSDTSTDGSSYGSPRYGPSSEGSFTSDTDSFDFLCSDMDGDMDGETSTPLSASGNEMSPKLCMNNTATDKITTANAPRNIGITTSSLPEFRDLLGEQHQNNTVKAADYVSESRASRARQAKIHPDWIDSDNIYDDNDENDDDFVPKKYQDQPKRKRRSGPVRVQDEFCATKRSRRKSPKLWVFLLESLCDPSLNPSIIKWHNKDRGVFKIEDTKRLSQLWGSRMGKEKKEGKQNMNYEKFSRAIRYYYKNQVLNSVQGRLTYQFGPNALGWRARSGRD